MQTLLVFVLFLLCSALLTLLLFICIDHHRCDLNLALVLIYVAIINCAQGERATLYHYNIIEKNYKRAPVNVKQKANFGKH